MSSKIDKVSCNYTKCTNITMMTSSIPPLDLSSYKPLTEALLSKHINWTRVSKELFADKKLIVHIDWLGLNNDGLDLFTRSEWLNGIEQFIGDHEDVLDWKLISYKAILSESFIRKFKHKVNWKGIYCNQKLSKQFREECKKYIRHKNYHCHYHRP